VQASARRAWGLVVFDVEAFGLEQEAQGLAYFVLAATDENTRGILP
jgi:hypothetical protein